ncbi:MAG: phosphatidate cytidylyltransferase [Holosporales bacterium]|jgi:phosphatidate cytidylyltransferase|nr:phosphatidate cytidylyltransferase [Holosporales bacterium]
MSFCCAPKAQIRELVQRFISAVVIVLLTVASIYIGGLVFRIFVAALFGGIAWEWLQATGARYSKVIATIGALFLIGITSHRLCDIFFISLGGVFFVYELFCCSKYSHKHDVKDRDRTADGLVYAFLSFLSLADMHSSAGRNFVLFMFLCIWLTDTGAFFLGRIIGGPKLAPKISPKKTWSGAIGGTAVATIVGSYLGTILVGESAWHCALIAGEMSVCAHIGDLIESAAKRAVGVKDMSHLVPGHGGLADRFDSVMFVSLAFLLLLR